MTNFTDVGEFHRKFNLPVSTEGEVRELPPELLSFRLKFLKEELREFELAMPTWTTEADHAQMFDALIDLVYVAMGTAHLLGYPWERGWELVQAANMKKIRAKKASESKRDSSWDVVKPPGWQPPDIEDLIDSLPRTRLKE